MRSLLIVLGVLVLMVGFVCTFIAFGSSILYTWPLLLIGIILVLLGLVLPNPARPKTRPLVRSCPTCGADLPDDAAICPACGKLH